MGDAGVQESGPFQAGEVIGGRFEVLDLLGAGGIGFVYLILDRMHDEQRALKVLRPEFAKNELAIQRFMREVKAARSINHPGLVRIYDTGKLSGALFYTMERVCGESLSERVRRDGPLAFSDASSTIVDVCRIFETVHEHAIHRDLSSDNVMVTEEGSIKILDFGITRLIDEESDLTGADLHLGKLCYSAPEQMVDARSVDLRADIYSITMLYQELLSGKPEFGFVSPRTRRPELPEAVDAVLQRGLAQRPEDRFASASELRAAVESIAGDATGDGA